MFRSDFISELRGWLREKLGAALLSFFLNVAPVPASRPRVSKWGAYYGKRYTAWRKDAEAALAQLSATPTDKPVVLVLESVCPSPKKPTTDYPRPDADNFAKAQMDAITRAGRFWADDTQVVVLVAAKRFALPGEAIGTDITAYPI